jgi:uncharacterized heparinase superfamily protein
MLTKLALYFRTVRYLRPIQIYGRFKKYLYYPKPDISSAPGLRKLSGEWQTPIAKKQSLLAPQKFRFNNVEMDLREHGDYSAHMVDRLWLYNYHYFDDLTSLGWQERNAWHKAWLERWVRENPPSIGCGWEPYPTSLRIVNWIKWVLSGNELPAECLHSLAIQVRWLSKHMEIHLLGNHLFANAKALVFAGLFFDGKEADGWLRHGLKVLAQEIPVQILQDGGHFERSVMYHSIALEDMMDLYNITGAFTDAISSGLRRDSGIFSWPGIIDKMRRWLSVMSHPDGDISFFNDSVIGGAPVSADIEAYAKRLALSVLSQITDGVIYLSDSGYARLQSGAMTAILDTALIGPDYLPGHAHADTLSFELSLLKQRIFVNSGISCYGDSQTRRTQRGTGAHNTMRINGIDSSEVWNSFRVARRARIIEAAAGLRDGVLYAEAAHDGYKFMPGQPIHQRSWRMLENKLCITDSVNGFDKIFVEIYFHLHPALCPIQEDAKEITVQNQSGERILLIKVISDGDLAIERYAWHPEFGLSLPSKRLVFRKEAVPPAVFEFHIEI